MNVIDSYLDTLFAPYPDSARMREAKAELRAMMEDTQQGLMDEGLSETQAVGRVIAEFGTLEEVAPVLGLEAELGDLDPAADASAPPRLDLERARAYAEETRRTQWMPAAGISLFVLSAVPLLFLITLDGPVAADPSPWVIAGGISAVLVIVSLGLLLLGMRSYRLGRFEEIEEGRFTPSPSVRTFAVELRREHRRSTALAVGAAIMLWILCALPTVFFSLAAEPGSVTPLYGVCMTLVLVAAGLWVLIHASWANDAAGTLLQEEDEDEDSPEVSTSPAVRVIAAVYWPVAAAVYLLWSFLSGDWGTTWIVWPVAGVLYAGLWSLGVALRPRDAETTRRR
ncbi:permease prefix domain 1-containing protein [Brachybacterium sp. YJGR34]|uniref:permease prefix domain 1-containing protein n=1 Tax=Brachybacterium sp. YJGR34 TaxID=2059911 RepID=UPI000E0A4B0E|nr:permease prefix domain 1-containing protein [Brachybacterium sp. YJGR34]